MNLVLMGFAAAVALLVAGYAQINVANYTATPSSTFVTRAVLLIIGCAFGYVCAVSYGSDGLQNALATMIGFGAVHLPAAFILFIKRERGAGKS